MGAGRVTLGDSVRWQEGAHVTSTGSGPLREAQSPAGAAIADGPLYSGLQPRWCGLDSEEVAAHQRRRLYGAVIEAAGGRGYRETPVSELAKLAGVSKRTLYERFDSKEGLLLASFDFAVAHAISHVRSVFVSQRAGEDALGAAFQAFLRLVVEEPGLARLTLVDAVAAGPVAAERMERGRRGFESLLAASVPASDLMPRSLLKAMVGGVERVTRAHLVRGEALEPVAAGREMSAWVGCYTPRIAGDVTKRRVPRRAPPSRSWNAWLRDGDERTRLMRAVAAISGREGYEALEPARVARLAKLPVDSLESQFGSVESCFLATLELLCAEALGLCARAASGTRTWPTAVCAAMWALMEHLACHPVLARVAFIESHAPGAPPLDGRASAFTRFGTGFAQLAPREARPSKLTGELVTASVWTLVYQCVARDAKDLLPLLSGQAAFLTLAPMIGAEAAATAITEFETSAMQKPQAAKGRHPGSERRS